jgi:hypothetical protein
MEAVRSGAYRPGIALAVLLVCGIAVRAAFSDYPLWYDEIASVTFTRVPLGQLWSEWFVRETNPPLYYTLLKWWIELMGGTDLAIRALSVLTGGFGIILGFVIARRIAGIAAGLTVSALMAFSASHILYSQLARGYILGHSAALLALWATLRISDWLLDGRERDARLRALDAAAYILGTSAALYSHTTLIVLPLIVNITVFWALLVRRANLKAYVTWSSINLVVLLIWSWWGWITLIQLSAPRTNVDWIPKPTIISSVTEMSRAYLTRTLGPIDYVMIVLTWSLAAFAAVRIRTFGTALLMACALGCPAVLFLLSLKVPVLMERTLFWGSGPFLILVGVGITHLPLPKRVVGLAASVVLLAFAVDCVGQLAKRQKEDWPAIIALLRQLPRAPILVKGESVALAATYYCAQSNGGKCELDIEAVDPGPGYGDHWGDGMTGKPYIPEDRVPALLEAATQVYTIDWHGYAASRTLGSCATPRPTAFSGRVLGYINLGTWSAKPGCSPQAGSA